MTDMEKPVDCAACRAGDGECAGRCGAAPDSFVPDCRPASFCPHCDLTEPEKELLEKFAVTPFLPLLQDKATGRVTLLEDGFDEEAWGALLMLRRRGFLRIDPDIPLVNADYGDCGGCTRGSAAITPAGQDELDRLEYGSEKDR